MNQRKVVGVSYAESDSAPRVILKGTGDDATVLLDRARAEGDIPLVKNPELANALYRVPIDAPVGRELFPVMAVLLAHVIRLDQQRQAARGDLDP